ncbi:MAG TPA: amino acid ABC transporter permease [Nocardioidaceae bacterium]|nr:amino acid ABC transporter permease [Nocardioidaceae bacterium]
MSAPETVLYDAPGPRARRRALIGALIATVAILAMIGFAVKRLADAGQFSMELWGPLINPADEDFGAVWQLLFRGLQATLTAAVLAIIFSLIIGTLIGVARMMLGRWTRTPLIGVIEILRGLPVVITIYFASRVLPEVGVNVSPLPGDDRLWYLVIGLTAYNCVIIAEILRAGVASLPSGQGEAARAIGMTEWQTMRTVLLPQAFRTMLPALISQLVVILKDTSLAAVLGGYIELLRRGNIISQNLDNPIQTLFVVGLIFIALNYGLSRLAVWTERYAAGRGKGTKAPDRTGAEVVPKT